jgi:hypothetical protein
MEQREVAPVAHDSTCAGVRVPGDLVEAAGRAGNVPVQRTGNFPSILLPSS